MELATANRILVPQVNQTTAEDDDAAETEAVGTGATAEVMRSLA
jgi:hypothetical protein